MQSPAWSSSNKLPVIKGSNPDMERHILKCQSTLDCHAFGRKNVRPTDVLHIFRKALASGSTREKVYDTCMSKAYKQKRLPHEAVEVYNENLETVVQETAMQRLERERETQSRAGVRASPSGEATRVDIPCGMGEAARRSRLHDLEQALPGIPLKDLPEIEEFDLVRVRPLDGDGVPRKPQTWEEVADCVGQELDTRIDAR